MIKSKKIQQVYEYYLSIERRKFIRITTVNCLQKIGNEPIECLECTIIAGLPVRNHVIAKVDTQRRLTAV
jgi:hypothetical protein